MKLIKELLEDNTNKYYLCSEFLRASGRTKEELQAIGYLPCNIWALIIENNAELLEYWKTQISRRGMNDKKSFGNVAWAGEISKLRYRIKEGIKENRCELCGLTNTWNGKPIMLQMDHINGISDDHRLENLQILCPNCHSQTDTYCGRNIKR
jgi:hypothetical protein